MDDMHEKYLSQTKINMCVQHNYYIVNIFLRVFFFFFFFGGGGGGVWGGGCSSVCLSVCVCVCDNCESDEQTFLTFLCGHELPKERNC